MQKLFYLKLAVGTFISVFFTSYLDVTTVEIRIFQYNFACILKDPEGKLCN
jgi:hypothetical protein